jgi:surface antigen
LLHHLGGSGNYLVEIDVALTATTMERHMVLVYKKLVIPVVALVLAGVLTACETTGPKTAIGGLGGAAAGGLLAAVAGGNEAGIAAGTILGGLIGGAIGSELDAADRRYASQTAQEALEYAPVGSRVSWQNPDSGHFGMVTPTRTYQTAHGYCREYQQWVTIGGVEHASYGTACRQPDGTWRIVN